MLKTSAFLSRLIGLLLVFTATPCAIISWRWPDNSAHVIVSNGWGANWFGRITAETFTAGAIGGVLLLVAAGFLDKFCPKTALPASDAYGSSRFSTTAEMRKALLQVRDGTQVDGVVLCQESSAVMERRKGLHGRPSWAVAQEAPLVRVGGYHVLVEASTGSGKGEGVLLPTLLTDRRSVVVLDPKSDGVLGGELYENSAGFRDTFSTVRRFAPTEAGWHRFNPLLEVPLGTRQEGKEAYRVANVLTGSGAKEDTDSRIYWKSAEVLLTCSILDRLHHGTGKDRSLPGVFRMLSDHNDCEKLRNKIVARAPASAKWHAKRLAQVDDRILNGAFDTVLDVLSYCGDELIASNLEGSDFRCQDLAQGDRPMSLYLSFPFGDADILKPLARLMTNMLIASHLSTPHYRQQTVYLLDEFDDLGYLPAITKAITKIRSYGVQLALITQTRQQVYAIYEHHADIVLDNCKAQVIFGITGRNAAQKISESIGKTTISQEAVSNSRSNRGFFDPETRSVNKSIKEHQRDLMTAAEVTTMAGCDCLVFGPEMHPYLGKLAVRYSMPALQERAAYAAPGAPRRAA